MSTALRTGELDCVTSVGVEATGTLIVAGDPPILATPVSGAAAPDGARTGGTDVPVPEAETPGADVDGSATAAEGTARADSGEPVEATADGGA